MKHYIIIGNGVAAAGCIEGIRSVDTDGSITVISEEKHPVYCRPLISYYLEGKTDMQRMKYRADDYYEKFGCEVLYGKKAVAIDAGESAVILDDGTRLPYNEVCVASGSSPFVPPFEGLDTVKNKFSFMTMDDMLSLEAAINGDSRVLIVGAGLIGLKCAEGLRNRVAEITVCDLADRVLSSILDADSAAIVEAHLKENGIKFLLSDSAVSFNGGTAVMKSGKTVEFDVLVLAVGVRANTRLVSDIGGDVGRGIVVNERMETSIPHIYAAGDCTECEDASSGTRRVMAILPNAYIEGKCAGINMAGGSEVFDRAIPMNSIGFFGLHIMSAGTYCDESNGGEVYEEKDDGTLRRLFTKDGRLTGFILIGDILRAGIYTSLIREKVPLDTVNFDILKRKATLAAFSPETRRKQFGGVV